MADVMRFTLHEDVRETLLLQRTEYQRSPNMSAVSEAFYADLAAEFAELAPHLPNDAATIVDIGGGLGGIDIFLLDRYRASNSHLYLLDRDAISDEVKYFFEAEPSAYNRFAATRRFLNDNGISDARFTLVDMDRDPFPAALRADLVISLLAWGYHFPVQTYLDAVLDILPSGGCLVVDLRKGTDGIATLMKAFSDVVLIRETFRQVRVVAYR